LVWFGVDLPADVLAAGYAFTDEDDDEDGDNFAWVV
jgi:hypothetical protein